MIFVLVVIVSVLWYPHSIERVHRLGYDFTVFYNGPQDPGWVYANWLSIFFEPLRMFEHDTAFKLHYWLCAGSYWFLLVRLVRYFPVVGWIGAGLSLYPYLLSQELGTLTPILAALCFTFPGTLLASAFKPYLAGFAVYHAIRQLPGVRKAQTRTADSASLQDEPPVSDPIRVLFLATIPWDSLLQRPQQLASRLEGCEVTYKSPWTLRHEGVFVMPYNARSEFVRFIVRALAFSRSFWGWVGYFQVKGQYDVVIAQSYFFFPVVKHFKCPIIYDRIDNEDGFSEVPKFVKKDLHEMLSISSKTVSARELGEGMLIPNGVDVSVWHKRKYVVYHGTISWWLDMDLIVQCADEMPGVDFLLIGPASVEIPSRPNIHHLGAVDYKTLPILIQGALCAIIPFKVNALTKTVDPVKLYEYRAMGIPVLATDFRVILDLVRATRGAFPNALKEIVVSAFVRRSMITSGAVNTWDGSAQAMLRVIDEVMRWSSAKE